MSVKKLLAVAVFLAAASTWYFSQPVAVSRVARDPAAAAYAYRASGRMISVQGTVARVLSDDRDGSPHQRFVIRTGSGQTLLVSHNLDLAGRLEGLREGDRVGLHGQYEWNAQGGVIHWTHDDPDEQHAAGYIDWKGQRFQ